MTETKKIVVSDPAEDRAWFMLGAPAHDCADEKTVVEWWVGCGITNAELHACFEAVGSKQPRDLRRLPKNRATDFTAAKARVTYETFVRFIAACAKVPMRDLHALQDAHRFFGRLVEETWKACRARLVTEARNSFAVEAARAKAVQALLAEFKVGSTMLARFERPHLAMQCVLAGHSKTTVLLAPALEHERIGDICVFDVLSGSWTVWDYRINARAAVTFHK